MCEGACLGGVSVVHLRVGSAVPFSTPIVLRCCGKLSVCGSVEGSSGFILLPLFFLWGLWLPVGRFFPFTFLEGLAFV